MASFVTKRCPKCGKMLSITPEAAKLGTVCPYCKTFVGEKNNKMNEEEVRKLTQAIHGMLHGGGE